MYKVWLICISRGECVAVVPSWKEAVTLCNKYESRLPEGCGMFIESDSGEIRTADATIIDGLD